MAKKKKGAEFYLRPDGIYEKIMVLNGKRVAFRSKDPDKIYEKIALYKESVEKGRAFGEVADEWKKEHFPTLTHNTQMGYTPAYKRIRDEFKDDRLLDIDAKRIDNYIRSFSLNRGYKTVANELLLIRLILSYACANSELEYNPADHVKLPKGLAKKSREFPSDKDIEIVKNSYAVDFGLLHYFIMYTGARLGEALAFTWADIDFKTGKLFIKKSVYYDGNSPILKSTKTGRDREGIILEKLEEVLKPLKKGKKGTDFIFARDGRLLTRMEVQRGKERFRRLTGFQSSPHALRHAYATMLFESDKVDFKTIQYLLGHAQLSTTMDVYTELRKRRVNEAAKVIRNVDISTSSTQ